MADVRRTKLPGVGVVHSFLTQDGGKCGVVTHRSGQIDLITVADYDPDDRTGSTKLSMRLDEDEAHTLAELLGGTRITESIGAVEDIPGLAIDWFHVDYDDHIAGEPLGDMSGRGMAGLTVVAVVRGDSANPAPDASFKVFPGDTLVVAGSPEKVAKAFAFFRTGELAPRPGGDSSPSPEG